MSFRLPELLLPAGTVAKLRMALRYGADAVYVGAAGLSLRPKGASVDRDHLATSTDLAHDAGRKIYVAVNSLMFDHDFAALDAWLNETEAIPFDAVIVSDLGVLSLLRERRPELQVHISTQMSIANVRAARFIREAGASRVILARECSLHDAATIAREAEIEVELFVHGAMCIAVSGRCLISAYLCGHSGSRGACKHSCRWEWQLVEQKRPGEAVPLFETGQQTILLGSKDLCLIEHIPELVRSGVRSLKVEGRMKSEYYVAAVARVYRAALDAYAADPEGYRLDPAWLDELNAVSHRPYCTGFAFGYPSHSPQDLQTHNRPVSSCQTVAYVLGSRRGLYELEVKNPFRSGEKLEWIGPANTGGVVEIGRIQDDQGLPLERTVSATVVFAELLGRAEALANDAILRRRA